MSIANATILRNIKSWKGKESRINTDAFKKHDYHEYLHVTMKFVITPIKNSLTALIFIS